MSYHAWTLRRVKPHVLRDTIYTLKRNTVKARHYLNIGTLLQNTARQSKTQDRQNTHSYLRLTRQSCRYHGHYTVHTTNMPRWHPLPTSNF